MMVPKPKNTFSWVLLLAAAAACCGIGFPIPSAVEAGTSGSINCGEVIESSLDSNDVDLGDGTWVESYDFSLSASSSVSVVLSARDFRPYVILTDDRLETLQEGDPPLIRTLTPGYYTVFANNYEMLPSGEYPFVISLSCGEKEVERIGCGQTVAGQLDPSDERFDLNTWIDPFELTIDEPTRVRFQITETAFEAIILLRDAKANDLGSRFDTYTLNLEPGNYVVVANNFIGLPDGTYPLPVFNVLRGQPLPG